jgi:hypothetical protein
MIVLPALITYIDSWWVLGTILILLGAVVVITMAVRFAKSPVRLQKFFRFDILDSIFAVILVGLGFIFHILAGEPGSYRYGWSHSLWHIFAMLGMYFVVEMKDGKNVLNKIFGGPDINNSIMTSVDVLSTKNTSRNPPQHQQQELYVIVESDDDDDEGIDEEDDSALILENKNRTRQQQYHKKQTPPPKYHKKPHMNG